MLYFPNALLISMFLSVFVFAVAGRERDAAVVMSMRIENSRRQGKCAHIFLPRSHWLQRPSEHPPECSRWLWRPTAHECCSMSKVRILRT